MNVIAIIGNAVLEIWKDTALTGRLTGALNGRLQLHQPLAPPR